MNTTSITQPAAPTARTTNLTPVSVIGLGMMGQALAQAFLAAGHPTTVWNRSSGKDARLVQAGALRADSIAEAVAASPLIVVCLTTYAVVREQLEPAGEALAGRTLVNLTTGIPSQVQELAAFAAAHGAEYLDGAILTIPEGIGQADTLLLYSGPAAVFERHQEALRLLGGQTTYLGEEIGLAALHDMALLSTLYGTLGGFLHAVALFQTAGSRAETYLPMVANTLTATLSWLPEIAREIELRHYETEVSSLDINREGVRLIVEASRQQGVSADILAPVQALIERRVAAGHGRQGLASLIEELRPAQASA